MHHESKTKRFTHQATLQEAALMGAAHHHWAMDGAEAVPDEAEADDGDTEAKPAEAPSEEVANLDIVFPLLRTLGID